MQAVVQPRGEVNIAQDVRSTLTMLNIHHVSHATFIPETSAYRGMILKASDFVAHSEPSVNVVEALINTRAEPEEGDGGITDEQVSENTDYDDVAALTQAIIGEETTLREQGVSSVIRLHPPRGDRRGQKYITKEGGQLGKHSTEQIDEFLEDIR